MVFENVWVAWQQQKFSCNSVIIMDFVMKITANENDINDILQTSAVFIDRDFHYKAV